MKQLRFDCTLWLLIYDWGTHMLIGELISRKEFLTLKHTAKKLMKEIW